MVERAELERLWGLEKTFQQFLRSVDLKVHNEIIQDVRTSNARITRNALVNKFAVFEHGSLTGYEFSTLGEALIKAFRIRVDKDE
jgi:hypothetical protein